MSQEQDREALVENDKLFRYLFENLRVGIYITTPAGEIQPNKAFLKMIGYSDDPSKLKWQEIMHPDDIELSKKIVDSILSGEKDSARYSKRYIHKSGSTLWTAVSTVAYRDKEGKVQYFMSAINDITKQRSAEKKLLFTQFAVDHIADAAFWITKDARIFYVNEAACRSLGYSQDELLTMTVNDIDPEFSAEAWPDHWRGLKKGKSLVFESVHKKKDGRIYPVEIRSNFVKFGDREYNCAFARNITDRRQVEKELFDSEKKYRELVENANTIILRFDTQGRVTFCNEFAQRFFGYQENEIIGQNMIGTILAESDSSGKDLKKMISDMISNPEGYTSNENENIKLSGERVWIAWRNKPIYDEKGRIQEILCVGMNITQRKQEEQRRIRLETAIEQAFETVMITDSEPKVQYVNPAFVQTTGYQRDEIIGQNPSLLKSNKHDRAYYDSLWKTISSGKVWSGHFVNLKKDGALFEEDATIAPVKDTNGKITNYVAVKRDVTDEIKTERQLRQAQKMEAIGTLAGGIAHDFNNILAAIIGFTELSLAKVEQNSPVHANLQEVFNAGLRARDLVKQILTFSRQAEQELQAVQAKLIVKEALKLMRASLPTTIEIRQNISSDNAVMADPTQIHQILINLCTNAGHAMHQKGGVLEVSLSDEELDEEFAAQYPDINPGQYMKLSVSDTGHGIPPDVLEKIFDPFFTTKEREEGTGMGLAVVHGIVRGHGGTITVYSEAEKGTTFNVYLPVFGLAKKPETKGTAPLPNGSEHILFVDDEKPLVDLGKELLERQGFRVTPRTSSIEALELLKSKPDKFDLVVTDMTMPNMTGKDLAKEIIRLRPDIPILICTGFSEVMTAKEAKAAGIRAFIRKPLISAELITTIREELDKLSAK